MAAEAADAPHTPPWWLKFTRWRQTSADEATAAEARLLAVGGRAAHASITAFDTRIGAGEHDFIHAVAAGAVDAPPLVLCPGYGAGAAFFFKNLGPLAAEGYRAYAVDWRGTGLSGRPRFEARTHAEAVAFFLDGLEAWRKENGIERFHLLGHSLGGYLAARYALAHPQRVERLILAGPAAVAERPGPPPDTWWYKVLAAAWEGGITPGSVVRCLGPMAPGHAEFYARKRFHEGEGLTPAEQRAFGDYIYHILAGEGSGEFALPRLLAPGAWAREPLAPAVARLQPPVTFVYGENDWMDWRAGHAAVQHARASAGARADLVRIPGAGHYAMIDQPARFHAEVLRALRGEAAPAAAAESDAAPAAAGAAQEQELGAAREGAAQVAGV